MSRLYAALAIIVTLTLVAGVGSGLYVLKGAVARLDVIEEHLQKATAASAETVALVNASLKGTPGQKGMLELTRLLLLNADGAANAAKQTAQDANRIAKAQEKTTAVLSQEIIGTVQDGRASIARLNDALKDVDGAVADVRSGTLPRLNAGVDQLNGLTGDLRQTAVAATGDLLELRDTIGAAHTMLADPELAQIAGNLARMTANGADTVGNLTLVTGDFHRMLNPKTATFWETFAMTVGKSLAGAVAGPLVSHFWPLGVSVRQ